MLAGKDHNHLIQSKCMQNIFWGGGGYKTTAKNAPMMNLEPHAFLFEHRLTLTTSKGAGRSPIMQSSKIKPRSEERPQSAAAYRSLHIEPTGGPLQFKHSLHCTDKQRFPLCMRFGGFSSCECWRSEKGCVLKTHATPRMMAIISSSKVPTSFLR